MKEVSQLFKTSTIVEFGVLFLKLLREAPIISGPDLLGRLVCMFVRRFREFYRGGKRVRTEASLAWYFDRKNVRTTFQVRKVTIN